MKRSSAFSLVLAVVLVASVSGFEFEIAKPSSAGFSAEGLAKIKPAMEKHIQDGKLVGGSGLIARNGKIVYDEVWGQRDREETAYGRTRHHLSHLLDVKTNHERGSHDVGRCGKTAVG